MINPLSTRRYTELVDRINGSFGLIRKYLKLKIEVMEKDLEDRLTLERTRQIVKEFSDGLSENATEFSNDPFIQEVYLFVEEVFEIAFGDNAYNRDFSREEVLKELRRFSDEYKDRRRD